jgi:hypothetical protein
MASLENIQGTIEMLDARLADRHPFVRSRQF